MAAPKPKVTEEQFTRLREEMKFDDIDNLFRGSGMRPLGGGLNAEDFEGVLSEAKEIQGREGEKFLTIRHLMQAVQQRRAGKLPERTGETMGEAIAISSPSGRMSERSRKAAIDRLARSLFGEGGLKPPQGPVESRQQSLLRRSAELRGLAARGMKPRAYAKEADKLEAEALELTRQEG